MTPYNFRRIIGYSGLAIVVLLLLMACAAPFDSNEHGNLTSINQMASRGRELCATPEQARAAAETLATQSQWIYIYSSHLKGNKEMMQMSQNLMEMTRDFQTRYAQATTPSRIYCSSKMENIRDATETMLKVSGRRTRS